MTSYLALDLGAESGRAILGMLQNDLLELREIHRFANLPVQLPSGLHWDVLYLWREIQTAIALAAARQPFDSLGIDTWGLILPCSTGAANCWQIRIITATRAPTA